MFLKRNRGRIRLHLRLWRVVKKNKDLKHAPSFWELATTRNWKIDPRIASSPKSRSLLDAHGAVMDIMSTDMLLDVSQSIDRTGLRNNGLVMTLTTTCGSINPRMGSCLTAQ